MREYFKYLCVNTEWDIDFFLLVLFQARVSSKHWDFKKYSKKKLCTITHFLKGFAHTKNYLINLRGLLPLPSSSHLTNDSLIKMSHSGKFKNNYYKRMQLTNNFYYELERFPSVKPSFQAVCWGQRPLICFLISLRDICNVLIKVKNIQMPKHICIHVHAPLDVSWCLRSPFPVAALLWSENWLLSDPDDMFFYLCVSVCSGGLLPQPSPPTPGTKMRRRHIQTQTSLLF